MTSRLCIKNIVILAQSLGGRMIFMSKFEIFKVCDLDLGTKMKNRAPWGHAGAIVLTKYRNPCQIRQTPSEKMQIEIGYPLKTHVFWAWIHP